MFRKLIWSVSAGIVNGLEKSEGYAREAIIRVNAENMMTENSLFIVTPGSL